MRKKVENVFRILNFNKYAFFRIKGGTFKMLTKIKKRDGKLVPFMRDKITWAIFKAASNVGGDDWELASKLCDKVIELAEEEYPDSIAEVEGVQDIVEKVKA